MRGRRALLVLLGVLPLAGCEVLPLAAVGSALGIAASVGGAGRDVYRSGKLDSAEDSNIEDVIDATVSTAVDLSLMPTEIDAAPDHCVFKLQDLQQAKVTVTLDARTQSLTRVRIDVGVFGSEPTARLFLQRLRFFLQNPAQDEEDGADQAPTARPV